MDEGDPYAAAVKSAGRLRELTGVDRYDVTVVLGSGWAPAAAACTSALGAATTEISVAELGGFTQPTVAGHAGTVQSLITPDLRVKMTQGVLDEVAGRQPEHLTVDLGRTSFLDAAGLRVIARAHRALTPRCSLTLRSPTRQVRLVLEVSGLAGECPIEKPGQPR